MKVVICGLTITSSWGNGHATTYRGLVRELCARGHDVLFLERDKPWYAENRDLPNPPYGRLELYDSIEDLKDRFTLEIRDADAVIVGSYVPEGVAIGKWVTKIARGIAAFYDIDTPVTMAKLAKGDQEYLSPELIRDYSLYLSFTGGPLLQMIEARYGSPKARPLFCSVDLGEYYPVEAQREWDLGYLGTYSDDRQPALQELLIEPARSRPSKRFIVAGPQYPEAIEWPENVDRIDHLPPSEHRSFYNRQRFTLNVTRRDMIQAGFSPSVRLFEAAACGTPIISDYWRGLDYFFTIGREILVARTRDDVARMLRTVSESERMEVGRRARERVLLEHSSARRACELEYYIRETLEEKASQARKVGRTPWKLQIATSTNR